MTTFRIGYHATRAEFRRSDAYGNESDPSMPELDVIRNERVRRLQDQRAADGPREAPATEPLAVLAEWLRIPANRQSQLATNLAEHPGVMIRGWTYRGELPPEVRRQMLEHHQQAAAAQGR